MTLHSSMNRFPNSWSNEELALMESIREAFAGVHCPPKGPLFSQEKLVVGESDHLFGLTRQDYFERREEIMGHGDLVWLDDEDRLYYFPAQLLASIGEPHDTDVPYDVLRYLTPAGDPWANFLRSSVSARQREAICEYLCYLRNRGERNSELMPLKRLLRPVEQEWIEEWRLEMRVTINFWLGGFTRQTVGELRDAIRATFPTEPLPSYSTDLRNGDDTECESFFDGRRWSDVPRATYLGAYGCLSLWTTEHAVYYLPGFLMSMLEPDQDSADFLENLSANLYGANLATSAFLNAVSPAGRRVVGEVLSFAASQLEAELIEGYSEIILSEASIWIDMARLHDE